MLHSRMRHALLISGTGYWPGLIILSFLRVWNGENHDKWTRLYLLSGILRLNHTFLSISLRIVFAISCLLSGFIMTSAGPMAPNFSRDIFSLNPVAPNEPNLRKQIDYLKLISPQNFRFFLILLLPCWNFLTIFYVSGSKPFEKNNIEVKLLQ